MKRITALAVALAVVALIALAAPALAQGPMGGNSQNGFGWMGGMMGGGMTPVLPGNARQGSCACGASVGGFVPGQAITPTLPYGYGRGGMMGGFGMTRGFGYGDAPNAKPITVDQAVTNAKQYVMAYNNADLQLVEVEEYSWNFYGVVKEKSTGTNAFQIIVDKYSGAIYPEMGPNMMWNVKYSPMAWMAGSWFNPPVGKMTVTVDQAHANAEQYLKTYLPNVTVEDKGDTFYGYYNFDVLQNGKTYGMLSVNGYTGAVWYHAWHGDFVSTKALE
jgi:hypothetical protein